MPVNSENSAVVTELEMVSFNFNPKERQSQRTVKPLHNCTHLTHQQSNVQISSSQASTVHEPGTSKCSSSFRKGRGFRDQISNIHWITEKVREFRKNIYFCFISSVQFSHSVMFNYLWPHGQKHARPPCPSPTLRACSNSCPLSHLWHPTISSSLITFSSCLQSFPASESFPMSHFFISGNQSIGASAPVFPKNIYS